MIDPLRVLLLAAAFSALIISALGVVASKPPHRSQHWNERWSDAGWRN